MFRGTLISFTEEYAKDWAVCWASHRSNSQWVAQLKESILAQFRQSESEEALPDKKNQKSSRTKADLFSPESYLSDCFGPQHQPEEFSENISASPVGLQSGGLLRLQRQIVRHIVISLTPSDPAGGENHRNNLKKKQKRKEKKQK